MTQKSSGTTGGRPDPERVRELERQEQALRFLARIADRAAETVSNRIDAEYGHIRPGTVSDTRERIARGAAERIVERSSLDVDQLLRLGESLVLTDVGVINSADGWIAVATVDRTPAIRSAAQ